MATVYFFSLLKSGFTVEISSKPIALNIKSIQKTI